MALDMGDKTTRVLDTRRKILDILKSRGPSLPVHIAKATGTSMIFAGAFLSELIAEKFVKTSNMKVGGSPLYMLPGQEDMLENFYNFLSGREKDAYLFLRESKVLRDDSLEPAVRVALRSIKDFAHQMIVRQRLDGLEREFIFWRYFSFPEEDAKNLIEEILEPKPIEAKKVVKEEIRGEAKKEEVKKEVAKTGELKKEVVKIDVAGEKEVAKTFEKTIEKQHTDKSHIEKKLKYSDDKNDMLPVQKEILGNVVEEVVERSPFVSSIVEHMQKSGIGIIEERTFGKKDYEAIVEIETLIGKMKFLAVGKDKKMVNDSDLVDVLQKAQALRLQALMIAPGKLNKKALDYLDKWHGFIKFRKM